MIIADLTGKTALVTGSERGIGKAIALALAQAGARVAAHGLAEPDEAQALLTELGQAGSPDATFLGGDLRHIPEIDTLMDEVAEMYEREVDYELKTLASQIEPILILGLGILVLILALGVFLPIWDLGKVALPK